MNRFILEDEDIVILGEKTTNGGKGSGNFGHAGRPGEVGGSSRVKIDVDASAEQWFEKHPKTREIFDKVVSEFEKMGLKRGFTLTSNPLQIMTDEEAKMPLDFSYSGRTRTDTATSGSLVYISSDVFDETFGQKYSFEKDGVSPFTDHTFEGILRHELGHLLVTQKWFEETNPKGDLDEESYRDFNKKLAEGSGASLPSLFSSGKWSSYAGMNSGEAIAEAFSNPDFSEDTRKVFEYVSSYKPKKQKNSMVEHGTILYPCSGYPANEDDLEAQLRTITLVKQVNGGKGSGNFGHAGRPGLVGGSSPSGETIANPSVQVTAKWLEEHREFLKSQGFTDQWIDDTLSLQRKRDIRRKALRAKSVEKFDEVWKEMQSSGEDHSAWYETTGKHYRESLEKAEEKKSNFDADAQESALKDLENTGIEMRDADKKWLRENCPAELIKGVMDGLKDAESKGLDLSEVRVAFTDATRKGGSCTMDAGTGKIKMFLTRDWLSDVDKAIDKAKRKGPDGERWWTNGKPNTATSHECGHGFVWQIVKNQGISPYAYSRLCYAITNEADDIFARTSGKDYWASRAELSKNEGHKYLSQYGCKNSMECIAESCNNPDFSEYTKIVNDLVMKGLKGEKVWQI